MSKFPVTPSVTSILLILSSAASHAEASICDRARDRLGLSAYIVDAQANAQGDVEIATDVDRDGKPDRLLWFRTGSGSSIPSDYSRVTLTLSSNGISYFVEGQWVSLVQYRGSHYAETTSLGRVPAHGVSPQPGRAEMRGTQRATADSRVGTVSLSVCRPSSCM